MWSSLRKMPHQMMQASGRASLSRSMATSKVNKHRAAVQRWSALTTPTTTRPVIPAAASVTATATRALSTLQDQATRVLTAKEELDHFMAVWPDVIEDLNAYSSKHNCPEASEWFTKVLEYNVPHGKKSRGIITVQAYKNLVNESSLTLENIRKVQMLGWCVEMLQTFMIMCDDIMDHSSTRRGQPCWHKLENVGMIAVNDSIMVQNAVYSLLKKNFGDLKCYTDLMELFHDVTFTTTFGQCMDVLNSFKSIEDFNMDIYRGIVTNKTAYYTFYLPFTLAMHFAGVTNATAFEQVREISIKLGHVFQVQDDYIDCYGDPKVSGKIGTDIEDNKCSWLAVMCMQKANAKQKELMLENYGKSDPANVAIVKSLYNELNLQQHFAAFEKEAYEVIKEEISQTTEGVPRDTLMKILNQMHKRKA